MIKRCKMCGCFMFSAGDICECCLDDLKEGWEEDEWT